MNFSAVILAGGYSRRMGKDKAFLDWQGQSLLAHQIETVQRLNPGEVFISGRPGTDYGAFGFPILHDSFPESGPLAGIEQALQSARWPHLLVLAVDMPTMTSAFLTKLVRNCSENRGSVPKHQGQFEPLAALYPKAAHRVALEMLGAGMTPVSQFVEICLASSFVHAREVSKNEIRNFANWNSPADRPKT